ncbi:phage tail tape measure protein [Tenacibaculum dicentrarchi]|uniref:phage tail tape measure protein n=1 Tax=Tenacibaculum dicentrarchi TaxID=669041 RepID=UPI0035186A0F
MAYKKKGVWDIDIVINGKAVKNTLSGVGAEVSKLNKDLKKLTPGSEEQIIKSAEVARAKKHLQAIKTEINGTVSAMDKMKTKIKGIGPMILAAFSVGAVLEFFKSIADKVNVLMKLKGVISQVTNLQGNALDKATSKVKSMAETFEADTQKMTEAAHNFAEGMEIDFVDALGKIEDGFLAGADANGEFLDKLKEYPVLLKEAGFSADEAIALMSQEVKLGIYSDKGIDAIKEANLRLREMPKATIGALNAIGLSSKTIQKELASGSQTTFDIMQKVSKKLSTLPPQSIKVGQAIADIFGGPGEDAGYKYLANLHAIDLTTNSLIDTTNNHVKAKKLELKANEALNNVWVKLTGVGSTMNVMYNSMKLSLASLLGTLTGVKDEADEAKDSFDEQAKKVVNLNKSLTPLITEYDNLSSKTNLSKQEQKRLKTVIQQIGKVVPSAITEFDKYGKAIGVSSDTAKEFMKNHKAMLKYRNIEVIEKETKKLAELNSELTNINKSLAQRDKDGDIIKLSHDIRPNNVITSEIKLDGNEIAKLQARATEIQGIQIGVQASLDEHTGDYLTKFVATEVKKTEKTKEEVIARDALEKTAHKFKIKNIEASTDEQLQLEINKIRTSNKEKGILRAKALKVEVAAKKKAFDNGEKELNAIIAKQKQTRLLASKTGIDKELLAVDQKYAALKEKFVLSEADKTNLTLAQKTEREAKIKKLDELQRIEKEELQIANDAAFKERLKLIEDENRIEEEAQKFDRDALEAETEEQRIQILLDKTKWIANEEIKIAEEAALKKAKIAGATEAEIAAIKKKFGLEKTKVETTFQKEKTKADKQASTQEKATLKERMQAYGAMFGNIAQLLGEHTAAGKAAAIAQATINTWQGVTEVWKAPAVLPEPFNTASKVLATATTVSSGLKAVDVIKSTKAKGHFVGGHTGDKALYHDGQDGVTGPVHVGEWVAPKWMNDNPRYAPTIEYLERERIKGPGYFDGGHVAPPTTSGADYDEPDETETFENNDSPMLLEQLTRLNNHLDNGIISYALIGDDEIQELKERTQKINNSRENAKIQ